MAKPATLIRFLRLKFVFAFSVFTLLLSSCVTETLDKKGMVTSPPVNGVSKKISGRVYCAGRTHSPVNGATVSVTKDNAIMFSTTTVVDGSYTLPSSFESDGTYGLLATAACGKDSKKLPKGTQSEIANQNFYLKK